MSPALPLLWSQRIFSDTFCDSPRFYRLTENSTHLLKTTRGEPGVAKTREAIAQKLQNFLHAGSGFGGDFEDLHPGPDTFDVTTSYGEIKVGGLDQIHLGDDCHIGAVEDGRILQRLVFAFRGGEQDEAEFFAEVIAGRADEIADVFDKEEIKGVELPSIERSFDHLGVEVTDGSGGDLSNVGCGTLEAGRRHFRLQVAQ